MPALVVVDHHAPRNGCSPAFNDLRRTGRHRHDLRRIPARRAAGAGPLAPRAPGGGHRADCMACSPTTGDFVRANAEDFEAGAFLSGYRDADVLAQIMSQARSKQTMEIIRRALGNRLIVENFSHLRHRLPARRRPRRHPAGGRLSLTEENVHTAIVYGIVTRRGRASCSSARCAPPNSRWTRMPLSKKRWARMPPATTLAAAKPRRRASKSPLAFCLTTPATITATSSGRPTTSK